MLFGNMVRDGGNLLLSRDQYDTVKSDKQIGRFLRRYIGADEMIHGKLRYCLWISDEDVEEALCSPFISSRLSLVAESRRKSAAASTRDFADRPHRFVQLGGFAKDTVICAPQVSSEKRKYLPVDYFKSDAIITAPNFALYDAPLWNFAIIISQLHLIWAKTVCGQLETRLRYSNTLGWNTFPIPSQTEKNRIDLRKSAERVLSVRETHFPKTIGEMYDPLSMPSNLEQAHQQNGRGRVSRAPTPSLQPILYLSRFFFVGCCFLPKTH